MSYSSTVLSFTPGGYWRLGESSGTLADSSGNGNTGTATGSPTYAQTGLLSGDAGTCLKFLRASSQRVAAADAASIDPGDTFTMMAWIQRVSVNANQNTIVSKGHNAGSFYINSSNQLELAKGQIAVIVSGTSTIADTTSVHFVAVTKSGSTVHLYDNATDVTGTVTNATCATNTDSFTIACDTSGDDVTRVSFGDLFIQEAAVFPTALTSGNISAIYSAGLAAGLGVNLTLLGVG